MSIIKLLKVVAGRMGFEITTSCSYSLQHGDSFSVWDDEEFIASLRNLRELSLWLRSYKEA